VGQPAVNHDGLLIVRKAMQHGLAADGTSARDSPQAAVPAAAKRYFVFLMLNECRWRR
jgi:hypothetical protein